MVRFRSRKRNTISVVVVFGVDGSDCDPERRTARQQKIVRRRDGDGSSGGGWQWWTATICQARPLPSVAVAATTTAGKGGHMGKGREPARWRTTTAFYFGIIAK